MAKRGRKSGIVSIDRLVTELRTLDARRAELVAEMKKALSSVGGLLRDIETPFPRVPSASAGKRVGRRKGFKMSEETKAKMRAAQQARHAAKKTGNSKSAQ